MKSYRCRNCRAAILWGDFCVDCVRAFAGGLGAALAAGLVGWLLS